MNEWVYFLIRSGCHLCCTCKSRYTLCNHPSLLPFLRTWTPRPPSTCLPHVHIFFLTTAAAFITITFATAWARGRLRRALVISAACQPWSAAFVGRQPAPLPGRAASSPASATLFLGAPVRTSKPAITCEQCLGRIQVAGWDGSAPIIGRPADIGPSSLSRQGKGNLSGDEKNDGGLHGDDCF